MHGVVLTGLAADYHKVDLVRAIRAIDDGPLEPALAHVGRLLAGEPVRFELATDADAQRFLAVVTRAGATGSRSG